MSDKANLPPAKALIRVSSFFTKHPSLSKADFTTYWRETHGPLVLKSKIFRVANVLLYSQVHNRRDLAEAAAKLGPSALEFEWDACSEMYFRTWEDYEKFAKSDEMRDVLGPDGARILCPDRGVKVMVTLVDPLKEKSVL
ncbi:EthD domain-containing protein [Aspergillus falconensis]